jgi:uncharacterized protein (DUF433 family)
MTTTTYAIEHIVSTPGICGGRPRIAGHRIRVQDIVLAYEGTGGTWSVERIAEEYEISLAQIHAALSYYYDHREEIEREMREDEAAAQKLIGEMGIPSVKEWVDKRQAKREDKP